MSVREYGDQAIVVNIYFVAAGVLSDQRIHSRAGAERRSFSAFCERNLLPRTLVSGAFEAPAIAMFRVSQPLKHLFKAVANMGPHGGVSHQGISGTQRVR
jgi:hypothetical protein